MRSTPYLSRTARFGLVGQILFKTGLYIWYPLSLIVLGWLGGHFVYRRRAVGW